MVSTRTSNSPLIPALNPPKRLHPRPALRPPKYSADISRRLVQDLDNDVLDIGPKVTPVEDLHKHYERRLNGKVVFFTKEGLEKWKKQERAKKQERGRTGGKSRAARTAAWKRGGGRERRADGRFRA